LDRFLAGIEQRAFQMARIATGNPDDALDLVQDAMIQLVQRYRNKPADEWPPLFYRILQNRIRDWYRRQKVRMRWHSWFGHGQDDDGDPADSLPDPNGAEPAAELASRQTLEQIEQVLHDLPLRQQQVFLLRAWEGLDVAETAKALGIGSGSVKTHYSRAVHKLREVLGDVGE
jgi:RNA polymerase sigma-70 factor (ECF subfamily)